MPIPTITARYGGRLSGYVVAGNRREDACTIQHEPILMNGSYWHVRREYWGYDSWRYLERNAPFPIITDDARKSIAYFRSE